MALDFVYGYKRNNTTFSIVMYWMIIVLVLMVAFLLVVANKRQFPDRSLWFALGIIGVWRYSWKAIHVIRAFYYQKIRYYKLRQVAMSARKPSQLLAIVTSYRTDAPVSYQVYKHLFDELERYGVTSEVAACISDPSDIEVINSARAGRKIVVHFLPQDGQGKRVAMANALQLYLSKGVHSDAQLVLMDGDSVISQGIFDKCCCFISKYNDLGAVTCNNEPIVKGNLVTRQWYRQRMVMRHLLMNSLSFSHKLLVLTGRFSLFKANILINKEFINMLEYDIINHWRYGRLKMLTGDDKTTWFYLLKHRWKMLYIPDATVYCLEEAISNNFFSSSTRMMIRWFGNMLRNNGRAIRVGPRKCGVFLWLCLLDQKISIWTTLSGPLFILILSLKYSFAIWAAYTIWVIVVRGCICFINWLLTGIFHPIFIFLLWYEQVVGASLKVYTLFRLDRQKWTRQAIESNQTENNYFVYKILPRLMTLTSIVLLFISLALYHGILNIPSI